MKKLIVTAIAAAVAVGTYADAFTQLRFKDASIGSKTIAQLNALAGETAVYWSGDELTNTYTVSAASLGTCPATIDTTPANGLDIKTTFGKPLAVNAVDGGAATNINTGIYFDSLVKFTVCDTDPQQDYNGAKIVMWLQEFENGNTTTTNLMVKAGDLSWNGRAVVSTGAVYKCGNTIDGAFADSWHRVTIKAIANITTDQDIAVPGFAIYIDGSGANCTFIANTSTAKWDSTFTEQFTLNYVAGELNNSNALFPSIDQTTDNKTAVLGASFDGTGSITDLVFTDVAPEFAADPEPPVAPKAAVVINDVPQTGIVTLADAVSAANGASAGSVVISLLENTEIGETLAFASAANVTLDFAGFVITNTAATAAISNAGNLTITNSVGNGGVACTGEGLALDATAGTTTITAGSFWGDLQAAVEGATLLLTGGSYQQDAWTLGGYLDDGKELQANSETGLNDVVDASVEPTTYTVTFVANGGTPVPESQTIDAGGKAVPPDHMTKDGYIFNGWTLNGAAYDFDTPVTGDITLVASWEYSWTSLLGAAVDGAYQIDDANDMLRLQEGVLAGLATSGVTFKQTANINMTGVEGFYGIGWFKSSLAYLSLPNGVTLAGDGKSTTDIPFAGVYDGQGYTISNVTLVRHNYGGVFNCVSGTVKNLTVQNIGFDDTTSAGAHGELEWGCAIVGNAQGSAVLENLTAAASTVWGNNSNHNVAGVAVRTEGNAIVRGCVNNANISATAKRVGGICAFVGTTSGTCQFLNCTNTAVLVSTSGERGVGGILGCAEGGAAATVVIRDCVDFGSETAQHATKKYAGAIVGSNWNESYTYTDDGGNTFKASTVDCGYVKNAIAGRAYAVSAGTIDGVAYLKTVKAADIAAGNTYKVLTDGLTATYAFAAPGTIAFDTNLIQNVTFKITAPDLALTDATADGVVTFTAATPGPAPIDPSSETATTVVPAASEAEAKANAPVATPTGVDAAEYKANFDFTATSNGDGTYTVTLTGIKETVETAVEADAMDVLTNAETDGKVEIPAGLYYKVTTMTDLVGDDEPVVQKGQSDGTAIGVSKPGTTKGFIKVEMGTSEYK